MIAAGRTDSGVHARGQVAHFDFDHQLDPRRIAAALNSKLPPDVQVRASALVDAEFHARRDAKMKRYVYRLSDGADRPVLDRHTTAWTPFTLDVDSMRNAAQFWIGKHDFSSFRAERCQADSPIRSITSFAIDRREHEIVFTVEGRSFLHNQIRIMIGTLVEIGRGIQSIQWAKEILDARSRSEAGTTLPPQGLCLEEIRYKEDVFGR